MDSLTPKDCFGFLRRQSFWQGTQHSGSGKLGRWGEREGEVEGGEEETWTMTLQAEMEMESMEVPCFADVKPKAADNTIL